jgi:hypothetical protein
VKTKPHTAWLITRGPGAHRQNEIVDILSARFSAIGTYVERLHNLACLTLRERANLAAYTHPPKSPYPAEFHRAKGKGVEVHCGHDPYFVARKVANLVVVSDGMTETVSWEPYGGGPTQTLVRKISG